MKFTMTVNLNNAAFTPDPRPELARLVADTASRLLQQMEDGVEPRRQAGKLYDANGNLVGGWSIRGLQP